MNFFVFFNEGRNDGVEYQFTLTILTEVVILGTTTSYKQLDFFTGII